MKKKIYSILAVLILAITIMVMPVTLFASDGFNLIATGVAGTEDRITVELPENTTLSQFVSISWEEWLVAGYPPHVDIRLDLNNNGVYDSGVDDVLVIEYAYNGHESDPQHTGDTAYGALTGAWYPTFNDDGEGASVINTTAFAWLNSGASGGVLVSDINYADVNGAFVGGSLADWFAGNVVHEITGATEVLYLEIEVDNWIVDTTAKIKNINVDFGGASADLTVVVIDPPTVVSVVLDLDNVDFGTIYRGVLSDARTIRVTNGGNQPIHVVATKPVSETSPFSYLVIEPDSFDIAVGEYQDVSLRINVPSTFAIGNYAEQDSLIFNATVVQ